MPPEKPRSHWLPGQRTHALEFKVYAAPWPLPNTSHKGHIALPFKDMKRTLTLFNKDTWASWVAQMVKNPPVMQESWVRSLGREDPLEKGMATHSSILFFSFEIYFILFF